MAPASPTLSSLYALHGARFTFRCRPCRYFRAVGVDDARAAWGEELTLANLSKRLRCRVCRMPVDGVHRTFDFSSTEHLWRLHLEGFKTDHARGGG